jgi:hypothetical protein
MEAVPGGDIHFRIINLFNSSKVPEDFVAENPTTDPAIVDQAPNFARSY